MNDLLWAALDWVGRGISVIPIAHREKRPAGHLLIATGATQLVNGKVKATWQPFQTRLPTLHELMVWFDDDRLPVPNIAVVTGWRGLVVLDFDNPGAWQLWHDWIHSIKDPLVDVLYHKAYQVRTARGIHLYVYADQPTRARSLGFLDIKAAGGYVLAPPSVHPSGVAYQGFNWPAELHVPSIESILPAAWLEEPERQSPPTTEQTKRDPWDTANDAAEPVGVNLDQLKDRVRIESLLGELHPTGGSYALTLCPLHDDHNPSMWVDLDRQICGCYAGCTDKPLDVINLYARMEGISNEESIRKLSSL